MSGAGGSSYFPAAFLDELRARTPLRPLVERRVKLARDGQTWIGRCPFHSEKTPSFTVYADGHYHCYGCKVSGDVIEFTKQTERIGFGEAVRKLASEAGMDLPTGRATKPAAKQTHNGKDHGEVWHPIVPPPADAPKPDLAGCIAFEYVSPAGKLWFYQRRFEKRGGDKSFGQLTYGTLTKNGRAVTGWHPKGPPQPYPLYRLDRVTQGDPETAVLVVEGEKACQAAERLFPDAVVTTWLNGAGSVHLADWSPLRRFKRIAWWPDADRPKEDGKPHGCFIATPAFLKRFPGAEVVDTTGLDDNKDGYDAADLEQNGCDDPDAWLAARLKASPLADAFQWSEDAWDIEAIPPRPWVGPPYMMRREITMVHGPGGASKSLIIAHWAIGLTLHQPFGRMAPRGPMRVLLTNFEDDKDEQTRRLSAALDFFNAAPADLAGKLRRVSLGTASDATMFRIDERGQLVTTDAWDALVWHCETFRPDVVGLDPLIAINAAPENDNSIMRRVMTMLRTQIAHRFNCALVLVHHDNKNGGDDTANDQTNARGGGDIVNAARFELATKGMTLTQAEGFGLEREQRKHYFRVGSEDSKRNYAAPEASEWFERSATLINNESVVRCHPWQPPDGKLTEEQATKLIAEIGKGTSVGPYSPQLGRGDRSLSSLLETIGIAGDRRQRLAMRDLKDLHGVETLWFRRPGRGLDKRRGLRTAAGTPYNCEWCEDREADAPK